MVESIAVHWEWARRCVQKGEADDQSAGEYGSTEQELQYVSTPDVGQQVGGVSTFQHQVTESKPHKSSERVLGNEESSDFKASGIRVVQVGSVSGAHKTQVMCPANVRMMRLNQGPRLLVPR
jgi:hypothetical protein